MTQPLERVPDGRSPASSRDHASTAVQHARLRRPHRARSTLRTLRAELLALYQELSAALLPAGRGKK